MHEDFVSVCMDTTCTEYFVSACTDVSTDSTGVHGRTCLYISTKVIGVHGVTYTDKSMVNMVIRGRINVYGEYKR